MAEAAGVLFGLIGVVLTVRQSIWCWPAGLANVTLFMVVFFHAHLYGSMGLQAVYFGLSVYGWRQWLRGGAGSGRLAVSRTPRRWALGLAAAAIVAAAATGQILSVHTDAALPRLDAALTACSLVAQWMTTRKWIETWLVWIAVDAVYVGMYASQQLHVTAVLYAVFLVLAVAGWREWRQSMTGVSPGAAA